MRAYRKTEFDFPSSAKLAQQKRPVASSMSEQDKNSVITEVNHLKDRLALVLNLNMDLRRCNNRLETVIQNFQSGKAYQELARMFNDLISKNDELLAKNKRLEAVIETCKTEVYLPRMEALALENEQMKSKIVNQRTLISALLHLPNRQHGGRPSNGLGTDRSNNSLRARRTSGRFVPAP
ncbi:hypothetical protein GYMLUDRAFT_243873 [Collybiopsis luxurians FD-317 M1]|uniref:Uncharacterized protein n=1 Tax=Collybiopsis luxurians FD-317 M1 TaxID=944289 RepID=A0A0D0CF74_9AGAR|nr:hypothetical protein GYMLUDRAFT_243873 [Collybiopsis luxurians FD-317 M1]